MADLGVTLQSILETRAQRVELLAAAFEKQMGPVDVLEYELVERVSEDRTEISWFFRKKQSG